jgi:hypothetical protein
MLISGARKPPNAGKGRKKGVPNRATADVREAIAMLLKRNTDKLEKWLHAVAEGEKVTREDGKVRWLRMPDPGHALRLMSDLAEYHIPKLARTELTGKDGEDLQITWPLAKNPSFDR